MVECQDEVPGRNAKENGCLPEGGALLSVIVPVYNVEAYLRRCLDSLCSQSYSHLEIICVDDGSTDGSLAILREYEAKDSRIRVVSKPNGGVSSARNAALDVATGVWITGVDPDDYMVPDAYSIAMSHATDDVDMVVFGMRLEAEPGSGLENNLSRMYNWSNYRLDGKKKELNAGCFPAGGWYMCNKLYRRSLIEEHGIRFDESIRIREDLCFHLRYCAYARTAFFCRDELYVYIQHAASAMNQPSPADAACRSTYYTKALENVLAVYMKQGLMEAYAPFFEWFIADEATNIHKMACLGGCPAEGRIHMLEMLRRLNVQQYARLAPVVCQLEEQLRCSQRVRGLFEACGNALVGEMGGAARALHVAIPVNEQYAGPAALSALSLRQTQKAGRAVMIHFICDGVSPYTKGRLEALAGEQFHVVFHEPDAAKLCWLPPLEVRFPRIAWLKMMVPRLLPEVGRALVLTPGVMVRGELPMPEAVDMDGRAVAVLRELPVAERERIRNILRVPSYDSCAALLMDMAAMREHDWSMVWCEACILQPRRLEFPEADSFNLAFQGAKTYLPSEEWAECLHQAAVPDWKHFAHELGELMEGLPIDVDRQVEWLTPPESASAAPKPAAAPEPAAARQQEIGAIALQYTQLLRRCRYYKFMAKLTWGRKRRHYRDRYHAYRDVIRQVRQHFSDSRRTWGL